MSTTLMRGDRAWTAAHTGRMALDAATRSVIDQAMGIVVAQNHADADAAFAILSRASQNRNVKLRDVVAAVSRPAGR